MSIARRLPRSEVERRAVPGGSGYRWTILAIVAVANGIVAGVSMGLPVLGPALRESLSLSLAQLGLVLAAFEGGLSVTPLVWGKLSDVIGERAVITTGLFGGAGALAVAAIVEGFGAFLAALVVCGMIIGAASTASGSAVMGWFGRHQRGFALGIRQMSVPIGGAIAALTLPLAVAFGGVEAALLGLAGAAALVGVVAAVAVREPPPAANAGVAPPSARRMPLLDRRVWRQSMGAAVVVFGQTGLIGFLVIFLHDHRGLAVGTAAAILAALQVSASIARVVVGRWSDRSGRRVPLQRWLSFASGAGFAFIAVLVDAPLVLLVPVILATGVFVMSGGGLALVTTAELAGRANAGTAIGLFQTFARGHAALAGVAFGTVVGATAWPVGFALLGILSFAGSWILRPLVADEEDRIVARDRRLAAAGGATAG